MAAAFFAALMGIGLACVPSANGAKTSNNGVDDETFDAFVKRQGRSYKPDSAEYAMRLGVFEKRQNEVLEHNGKPGQSYKVTLNHFSDRTDHERKKYLGLRPTVKKAPMAASMLETEGTLANVPASTTDWTTTDNFLQRALTVATGMWDNGNHRIPNQGWCGSCWAVTTAALLEAHYEIKHGASSVRQFSAQDLVNCVPNPHSCGGGGGCEGATVELAMSYIKLHGLDDESQTPYTGTTDSCLKPGVLADGLGGGLGGAGMVLGHTTLPVNQAQPLMQAMYTLGPVALSVAAGDWFNYNLGVFDGCTQNEMVIDHAVLGYGYAPDYWKIRNSWGANWGEAGFIRLARTFADGDHEDDHCAPDNHPEQGVGCLTNEDGSPVQSSVKVCGMCGILMDSVYPHLSNLSTVVLQEMQTVVVDGTAVVRKALRSDG